MLVRTADVKSGKGELAAFLCHVDNVVLLKNELISLA